MAPPCTRSSPRLSRSRSPTSRDGNVRHRSPIGNPMATRRRYPPRIASKRQSSPDASQSRRETSPMGNDHTVASPIGRPSPPASHIRANKDLLYNPLLDNKYRLRLQRIQNGVIVNGNGNGNAPHVNEHIPHVGGDQPLANGRSTSGSPSGSSPSPPSFGDAEIRFQVWAVFHVSSGHPGVSALFRPRDIKPKQVVTLADISLDEFRAYVSQQLSLDGTDWILSGNIFYLPPGRDYGEILLMDDVQFKTYLMLHLTSTRRMELDVCWLKIWRGQAEVKKQEASNALHPFPPFPAV